MSEFNRPSHQMGLCIELPVNSLVEFQPLLHMLLIVTPVRCNDNIVAAPVSDSNSLAATRLTYYCRNRISNLLFIWVFYWKAVSFCKTCSNDLDTLTFKVKAHPRLLHQCRTSIWIFRLLNRGVSKVFTDAKHLEGNWFNFKG